MQPYAEAFYKSKRWQRTSEAYRKSVGGLCEKCMKSGIYRPAEAVHHKIHLTPENIHRPEVALAWENLEALCRDCHGGEHRSPRRWRVDPETGRTSPRFGA